MILRRALRVTSGRIVALAAVLVAVCAPAQGAEVAKTGYHVTHKYTIGGDAGWDYIVVDPEDRRVYVTHYRSVEVLDADTGKVVGRISNMNGARGVALVKSLGQGFASNGKTDSVMVVDLKTLKRIGEIKAGKKPDAIIYDPGTDRVLVNNGDSDDMTVIDPKAGKVVGTIPLGGGPEFLAADGKGTVWTNLFDKGAFVTIDVNSLKVTKTTPIEGCKGASSMAFDATNRRLFIGCHSRALVVVDPDSGKIVKTLPIGEHADGMVYDAANRLIFASTGDGFVTVVHQDSADAYTLVENVKTMRGAKTLGFDSKTGKLFSATVENVPPSATSQPAPLGKVAYEPGPFVVVEIGK
jgi:YVTN family beta-propeller protein